MYAIWCNKRKTFKTTDGWAKVIKSKKSTRFAALEDLLLFTLSESQRNPLPEHQEYRHVVPVCLEWDSDGTFKARELPKFKGWW